MKSYLILATALAAVAGSGTAPDPPPRTVWMRQACNVEDGVDCFWNAAQQGDHHGHSFYVHRFPGGPTCTMYVEPAYARHHDRCRQAG